MRIEPRYLEVNIGDPVEFACIADGEPLPRIEWTGGRGGNLSPESTVTNGVLLIPRARKSDEAEYMCTATNSAGTASVRTILYVRGGMFKHCPGANFTNRLKLDQLSLYVTFKPKNRLKTVGEIGPWINF